ncbi:MAG TPA: hypothetical protein VN829_20140, partial [Dongiaceae bacterium]|nr:hypothetical protein [Dongiaceae bacterium]
YAEQVVRAGACGYISKREATTKLMGAVRRVLGGEIYLGEAAGALPAAEAAAPGWPKGHDTM